MDAYGMLGVARNAAQAVIKAAYRRLSKKHHPDREGGDAGTMAAINAAYEKICTPERRAHYDKYGDTQQSAARTVESKAELVVAQIITQALDGGVGTDLVSAVKIHLEKAVLEADVQKKNTEKEITRLQRVLKSYKYKKDDVDIIRSIVEVKLEKARSNIADATKAKEVFQTAAAMFSGAYEPMPGAERQVDRPSDLSEIDRLFAEHVMGAERKARFRY